MLASWFLLIGVVMLLMAFTARYVDRLPLTAAVLYLAVGAAIGPLGTGMLVVDMRESHRVVETLAEVAVLISLFAVGLRLRAPFTRDAWRVPLMLAGPGMVVGILLTAFAAHFILGLPAPLAFLLGAVLAPTDPVLASDVQVRHAGDRDTVRFALTAEGGMNDGTAFPGVMLGLGWLGLHELGAFGWRWVAVDLVWAVAGGLAIGWACGWGLARVLLRLRNAGEPFEFEEFLALGVIALAYGVALACAAYGFLAVFAAGLAFRHIELARAVASGTDGNDNVQRAEKEIASRLLVFTQQVERVAEVAVVLLVGAMIASVTWSVALFGFVAVMFVLIRPLTVLAAVGPRIAQGKRRLLMWFGIRGVGSIYYLAYAVGHGLPADLVDILVGVTVAVVAGSVIVHGISATPLMERYHARSRRRR